MTASLVNGSSSKSRSTKSPRSSLKSSHSMDEEDRHHHYHSEHSDDEESLAAQARRRSSMPGLGSPGSNSNTKSSFRPRLSGGNKQLSERFLEASSKTTSRTSANKKKLIQSDRRSLMMKSESFRQAKNAFEKPQKTNSSVLTSMSRRNLMMKSESFRVAKQKFEHGGDESDSNSATPSLNRRGLLAKSESFREAQGTFERGLSSRQLMQAGVDKEKFHFKIKPFDDKLHNDQEPEEEEDVPQLKTRRRASLSAVTSSPPKKVEESNGLSAVSAHAATTVTTTTTTTTTKKKKKDTRRRNSLSDAEFATHKSSKEKSSKKKKSLKTSSSSGSLASMGDPEAGDKTTPKKKKKIRNMSMTSNGSVSSHHSGGDDKKKKKSKDPNHASDPTKRKKLGRKSSKKSLVDLGDKKSSKKRTAPKRLELPREYMQAKPKKSRQQLLADREKKMTSSKKRPVLRAPENKRATAIVVEPTYEAPVHEKTQQEEKSLQKALSGVLPMQQISKRNVQRLVSAFQRHKANPGEELMLMRQAIIRDKMEAKNQKEAAKAAALANGTPQEPEPEAEPEEFFYVVEEGEVGIEINGVEVGKVKKGDTVGESNLYGYGNGKAGEHQPKYMAKGNTSLFRVDQKTYRSILQSDQQRIDQDKQNLLSQVALLQHMGLASKEKMAQALTPREFKKGETIVHKKKDDGNTFYIVSSGRLSCHMESASGKATTRNLDRGDIYGKEILSDEPKVDKNKVVAESDGLLYELDRAKFEAVVGKSRHVLLSPEEAKRLTSIPALCHTEKQELTAEELLKFFTSFKDRKYKAGETIIAEAGELVPAALYIVREGRVAEKTGRFHQIKIEGEAFGQDMFQQAKEERLDMVPSKHAVSAERDCVVGVLTIQAYRAAFEEELSSEASQAAKAKPAKKAKKQEEVSDIPKEVVKKRDFKLKNLVKKTMLGEGQFGQVWLVGDKTEKEERSYALKIQSKWELVNQNQAGVCIREKQIMSDLDHPFVIKLFASFHDKDFVYLLLDMVNGGELWNLIYPTPEYTYIGLPEKQAKFYALVVADILAYVHSKKYVYRDLKPENILISKLGYPTLIDFGFTKRISAKTFTMCGTPGYMPPEMILSSGHDFGADHWALGIMTYEMLTQQNYFFLDGMDEPMLYKSIVEDDFDPPTGRFSKAACDFMSSMLEKDPVMRLGGLAGGEDDILNHPWFGDLDLDAIRKQQVKAPWVPDVSDPFDATYFDDWGSLEDKTKQDLPSLSDEDALLFAEFEK